jgi:hypothetical protein
MKQIKSLDEYYTIITTDPCSVIIYSSVKTCHPCRLLKKWIDEEHSQLNIYDIDVLDPMFEDITNDIDCLPTSILQYYTETQKRVEGFNKAELTEMFNQLTCTIPSSTKAPITLIE